MNAPILVTIIICGTILFITIIVLLFVMWVITKGIAMSERK